MAIDREPRRVRGLHRIDDDDGSKNQSAEDGPRCREGSGTDVGLNGRVRMKTLPPRPPSSYEIFEDLETQDSRPRSVAEVDVETGAETEGEGEADWTRYISSSPSQREDTARRRKRFSMPAVALQTTSVVARTEVGEHDRDGVGVNGARVTRFSLVLGGRAQTHGHGGTQSEVGGKVRDAGGKAELGKGVAASKLSELLGRRQG
jgi:FYVE/RhoGEF/PH domain-containing protein 5/6